jgi:putative glutamine amidotransferase
MKPHQRPLVGIPADTTTDHGQCYHSVGDKYARAVAEVADCIPLVIPALADVLDLEAVLDHLDGVMLTGALSNVHPPHYGGLDDPEHAPFDQARDLLTLALVARCLQRGLPLLCICRGFQELNVALGGTLEGELQRQPGRLDHRAPSTDDLDARYGPAHDITVSPDGLLSRLLGTSRIKVNSLHRQGIGQLAECLVVEARADDGVIEAVSVAGAKSFVLGTQWHPEYKASQSPVSVRIFQGFGDAVRAFRAGRV